MVMSKQSNRDQLAAQADALIAALPPGTPMLLVRQHLANNFPDDRAYHTLWVSECYKAIGREEKRRVAARAKPKELF